MDTTQGRSLLNATLEEIELVIRRFPSADLKVSQITAFRVDCFSELKKDINANEAERRLLKKLVYILKVIFAKFQRLANNATGQGTTKRNEQNSDFDGQQKRLEKAIRRNTVLSNGWQEASGNVNDMELAAEQ